MRSLVSKARAADPGPDHQVDPSLVGKVAVMSDGLQAAAVSAGRAQRVQTIAASQASVALRWSGSEASRRRQFALAAGGVGFLGLALGIATVFTRIVPGELVEYANIGSLVALAVPVAWAIVTACLDEQLAETKLAMTAARSRSMATFGEKLNGIVEKLRSREGLDQPHRECLDLVLLEAEREIDQISAVMRADRRGGRNLRRDERIVPRHRKVVVRTADGRRLVGTVADLSVSGLALTEKLPHLQIGHEVTIGSRPSKVARVWEGGIAFIFKTPLDPTTFDDNTVL